MFSSMHLILTLTGDYMITYFFKNVKFNTKKLEEFNDYLSQQKYIQSFIPTLNHLHSCKCPKCGAIDRFSFHCTYERNLSFVLNGEIVSFIITITRVICNSCKSTHALLPDFISPYKIMASISICKIVKDALSSVLHISNTLNISYQQIYNYITLFLSFFTNVSILNNAYKYLVPFNQEIYTDEFYQICITSNFHYDYYIFFKWIFLMSKFRNDSSCNIYIGWAEDRST